MSALFNRECSYNGSSQIVIDDKKQNMTDLNEGKPVNRIGKVGVFDCRKREVGFWGVGGDQNRNFDVGDLAWRSYSWRGYAASRLDVLSLLPVLAKERAIRVPTGLLMDSVLSKGRQIILWRIIIVPAYLQKHLFANILKEEEFWTHPDRAIWKAYDKTDKAILSHSPDLGRGGSTAVTAILIDGTKLYVANVGDSRAVLAKGRQVIQMSVDHEPSTERGSIETRGGFVSNMPGDVPRVNGQLAVSRAFGDKSLKSHLRSDPDIRHEDVDSDTELLILASDGLWKVMSNEDAVDIARKCKDSQSAAKQLTTVALDRDSKDDISCIVVRFRS
ncbi:hypothetical protein J5N97_006771 [Dioscorea zingiberensis]|uniref:protein-serine/threonine phosphatase n=1 Tax=Dioscorea zingiberensis TaxID=325984 RepID=A0A9D5DAJ5_9LILI|nr:hypothetical protein J5N97_006771 [Dioscorea zingiberensis]